MKRIFIQFLMFVLLSVATKSYSANARFVDLQNGSMYDTVSNLIWLKEAYCDGHGYGYDGAIAFANSLSSGHCGLTDDTVAGDWHLPTIDEFKTLVDTGYNHDKLEAAGFLNVSVDIMYWSSSTFSHAGTQHAWQVFMYDGGVYDRETYYPNSGAFLAVRPRQSSSLGSLSLSPAINGFSSTELGTQSAPTSFTISNSSASTVVISSISVIGVNADQFLLATGGPSPCSSLTPTLAAGTNCTVNVTFGPTSIGSKTASLHVTSNSLFTPKLDATLSAAGVPTYNLSLNKIGTGTGIITPSFGTIIWWTNNNGNVSYKSGTIVTLSAIPNNDSVFSGWSGTCTGTGTCQLTMDNLKSVTATFTHIPINGSCGSANGKTYEFNGTLCASGSDWGFTRDYWMYNWSCVGLYGGSTATCNAGLPSYSIAVIVDAGQGTVSCNSVTLGSTATCWVTPATGYQLAFFYDNNIDMMSSVISGRYSIANVNYNHNILATFTKIPPINGTCGASNGGTFWSSSQVTNPCSSGSTSSVARSSSTWDWHCYGSNGGSTANCNANIQTYTISPIVTGGNGTINCMSPVTYGDTGSNCRIYPNSGYQLNTFTDNNIDKKSSVNGGYYYIPFIFENHTIAATFGSIPLTPVDGACGTTNGGTFSVAPNTNFCSSGSATVVTGSGPWSWSCTGSNGGSTANCSANFFATPVNGSCGISNGGTFTIAPTANICTTGTASLVAGSGPWDWTCIGSNGGTTANCNASLAATPVNGSCGSSNGSTFAIAPSSNFCSSGNASNITGTGPWGWSCVGSNGGTTATCSANKQPTAPDFVFASVTVYDRANDLTWTKDANTPGPGACATGTEGDWFSATSTYINCLNSNNYLGYNDWRVPAISELRIFPDNNLLASQLNSLGFNTVLARSYWSANTDTSIPFCK